MRNIFTSVLLLIACTAWAGEGDPAMKKMYDRYHGKWHSSLRFVQETKRYRNDSLISTSTWYETIVYPRMFRIDLGVPDSGNCVIYRNDSAYIFRTHRLVRGRVDTNDLLFMLGGMYFAGSYDEVVSRYAVMGYDVRKGYEAEHNGKAVYVVGTANAQEKGNQIWIDKKRMRVVKFVKYSGKEKEEGVFEDHKKIGKGWCETEVTFYINGKLQQREYYRNIVAGKEYDPVLFSPATPWKYHWYKP
ncbi:hypothetical protein GCM10023093_13780 [Nemorincola caseinilytica]|uniref:Outer membrane lipoprotein-sorting protein n=1 Tax=Nemorincola caseinilytica TaxID=2054315 RepID=A0ABP8NAL3_9BACT